MLAGCPTWPDEFAEKYRKEGCWRGETFGGMLRERADKHGSRIAVTHGDAHMSYGELDMRADRLAAGFLELGIKKEDRVIVQLPNTPEFFEVCFALFRIGALPLFALPSHRQSEIAYFCEFAEAAAYIIPDTHSGFDYRVLARQVRSKLPELRNVIVAGDPEEFRGLSDLYRDADPGRHPHVKPDDVAFLQLSGGSTGLSKLIPRTHDDYIYSLRISADICRLDQNSVYLAALPMAHNYPLSSPGVLGALYAGARVVLADGPSPDETFPLIEKERVTITGVVPPIALIWLEAASSRAEDLSSLEVFQVGGAKFSAEAARRVKSVLGCTLQQVFGMAEGLVNYTRLDDPEDIVVNTQGRPMSPLDEIKVVDENGRDVEPGQTGELLTRGPYTIRGYYKAEEHNAKAFTPDGFYRTGDLVKVNSSGYLIVEGRAKDQINRGGEKVAAEEVENHLLAHPGVHDAAVVSMPDDFLGERSCAYIIPRNTPPAAAELKQFLRERGLAAYKIPDRVEFTDSFPQTGVGKVSKKALRQAIAEKMAQFAKAKQ
ncbi:MULTISPECIES: (2,3-dihydroxybenzoyl)adenylate synthase [Bacillus]|uniref:(2,3-dihydroxybenzoyl)adenylate synthase n=1 Tax=Bacillus glycinifermentans TaxID=1664069 RepID=A0AAJ3Z1U8_9BACI|nr:MULTISPECIES: (2,3-dihydroxybenzoyl)adenylate synthase [Bacillus]KKB74291.1 enterobactin synthase subunit E [Bacillus sp. TH008]MDU0071899.1 (2,3-dihydroxybenzoyl)adenylate synthase [Bacillus sp. IG6]MED8019524.1 (2,3-dihydroxybenzoyl)adenylate synthase [Bacillus glycinifermentans]QAT67337.1 (2,3-dihydroxybenzoyl)adenylate synthase [Bacillus glycinifermentans]WKB76981.1 (2,3-dihydroxybenzoyl)adenylate synthase [Bacillus glycinifermentans]